MSGPIFFNRWTCFPDEAPPQNIVDLLPLPLHVEHRRLETNARLESSALTRVLTSPHPSKQHPLLPGSKAALSQRLFNHQGRAPTSRPSITCTHHHYAHALPTSRHFQQQPDFGSLGVVRASLAIFWGSGVEVVL
jgi:hypothetical protein